jgi:signal transduction histidine kinase
MPEGGILQISVAKKADLVEVFLNCCGTFVSEEDFDNVFKPFYLFKDIVLGMTLPICKRFVERNGGTIKISSAPAKGTVFTIGLPCIV